MKNAKIRLYVDHNLALGQTLVLPQAQSHYISNVMRMKNQDHVRVFNGRDGEFITQITQLHKKNTELQCIEQTKPLLMPPDVNLLFAPIKKNRTDFIVEKATEMGVAAIFPIRTDYTNSERMRQDRLQAHAVEAAEQCGGTYVPKVHDLRALRDLLEIWDPRRQLLFCDETKLESHAKLDQATQLNTFKDHPWAILIGPEGGFSQKEREYLYSLPFAHAISLGPRVLRADTAAVAALALWQEHYGDWYNETVH